MAVVNVLSTTLTNRDATPRVPNSLYKAGRAFHKRELATITNGDSVGSNYRYFSIPSSALVKSIQVTAPDIGTTTTADVGVFETTANGAGVANGTAANQHLFATGLVLNAGAIDKKEVAIGSTSNTALADSTKQLWQLAGFATDPVKDLDLVLTLAGAADGTGVVIVDCEYKMQ